VDQGGLDEGVELLQPPALPGLEAVEGHAQEVEGAGPLRGLQMGGELEDGAFGQPVVASGRTPQQTGLAHQQGDLLLGDGPQAQAFDQAPGHHHRGGAFAGGLQHQGGEEEPLGTGQSRPLGGGGRVVGLGTEPLDQRPAQGGGGIQFHEVGPTAADGLRQFR
jgi:hypothetical protein